MSEDRDAVNYIERIVLIRQVRHRRCGEHVDFRWKILPHPFDEVGLNVGPIEAPAKRFVLVRIEVAQHPPGRTAPIENRHCGLEPALLVDYLDDEIVVVLTPL